jgi:hypothetical protein
MFQPYERYAKREGCPLFYCRDSGEDKGICEEMKKCADIVLAQPK